ncbi:hypothetical protein, partial [Sinomicrobium sp. M5D2P9]
CQWRWILQQAHRMNSFSGVLIVIPLPWHAWRTRGSPRSCCVPVPGNNTSHRPARGRGNCHANWTFCRQITIVGN